MVGRKHKNVGDVAALEDEGILVEPAQVELGSGYTVAVFDDEQETPVVDIKIFGHVDLEQVRREIEEAFPNVQIRQWKQTQTVLVGKKTKKKFGASKKKGS